MYPAVLLLLPNVARAVPTGLIHTELPVLVADPLSADWLPVTSATNKALCSYRGHCDNAVESDYFS